MNVYAIEYTAGLGGTWLTALVNSHFELDFELVYQHHRRDYNISNNCMWNTERHSWVQHCSEYSLWETANYAYKLYPKHNFNSNSEFQQRCRITSNTAYSIVPYVKDTLYGEFVQRHSKYSGAYGAGIQAELVMRNFDTAYTQLQQALQRDPSIIAIDIGKLVSCDIEEYSKLYTLLNCDPIDNYYSMCESYTANVLDTSV